MSDNPSNDPINVKLESALIGQLERLFDFLQAQYGKKAAHVRHRISPEEYARFLREELQRPATIDFIEQLGKLVDDFVADPKTNKDISDIFVKAEHPAVALSAYLNCAHEDFYDAVMRGGANTPSIRRQAHAYWNRPDKQRIHTVDFTFEEIFPHAPKAAGKDSWVAREDAPDTPRQRP